MRAIIDREKEKGRNRGKSLIGEKGSATFGDKDRFLLGNKGKDSHHAHKN